MLYFDIALSLSLKLTLNSYSCWQSKPSASCRGNQFDNVASSESIIALIMRFTKEFYILDA